MMKTFLTAFGTFVSISCFSQKELVFPAGAPPFDWKGVEHKRTKAEADRFIRLTPKEFPWYKQKEPDNYLNVDSLRKDLHFIDLNGDGKDDVVFQGRGSGEAREVMVYINSGKGYQEAFTAFQGIVKMEWSGTRLSRIYIDDPGCCDDYLETYRIFDVDYSQLAFPKFKKVYQALTIYQSPTPDSLFEKPFRFEVLNEGYKIRSAPEIDDSSAQPWDLDLSTDKGSGNSIGKLAKGARGTALGRKVDKTGREWLYVQIDEIYFPKNDILIVDDKFPTKLIGWISSRFVRKD